MSQESAIEWTDHTFNPWWGCTKVSQGCKHCYAETLANRYGHNVWGPQGQRRMFGTEHWSQPLRWNRTALRNNRRARVFCASMADVFEDNSSLIEARQQLWTLIDQTPNLDWQILTKRPENVLDMAPWQNNWPTNVWIGTSVEDQETADIRIPILQAIPANIRFLSCEPLIGPLSRIDLTNINWLIAGGESGAKFRPCNPEWIRNLRDQCQLNGVAFFFKQWGGRTSKSNGRLLDGKTWSEFPNSNLIYTVN